MTEFLLATLSVMAGSTVQAVTGTGSGFVIVPLLALIDLALVPGPVVFASIALSLTMALRGRAHLDLRRAPAIVAGIVPGSIVGAWLLTRVSAQGAGLVFGAVILSAVALSLLGVRIPSRREAAFAAGATSGVLGAAAGIGGPVLALLYQDERGERLRATLGLLYACGAVVILIVLAFFGRFGYAEFQSGLQLIPGFVLGYAVSSRIVPYFEHRYLRVAVLVLSAASASALIVRSL
jgi:uncharacterized membrane protein YfcA